MDKESKPLTVFMVGLLGFYECKGCLSGSPMTLQPSRDYGDLPWGPQSPLVYHLSGWYSHLLQGSGQPPWEAQRLCYGNWRRQDLSSSFKMWAILVAAHLFGYLEHVISTHGIATDEGKINAIKNWPHTHKHHGGLKFLGIHGYYCWFIPKLMQVTWPLHELTSGENTGKKKAAIKWDSRCQQPVMTWRDSVPWHLFLGMQISPNHSNSILMVVALVWELSSIRPERMAPKQ